MLGDAKQTGSWLEPRTQTLQQIPWIWRAQLWVTSHFVWPFSTTSAEPKLPGFTLPGTITGASTAYFYCFITSILISSLLGLPSLRGFPFEWRHTGRWTRFHFRENLRKLLQLFFVALPQQTPTLCPSQPQHCDGCDWKRRPARIRVGTERVFYRPQRPECLVLSSLALG